MKRILSTVVWASIAMSLTSQNPVRVGAGSYASFPPTAIGSTMAHGGDQSTAMQTRKLWVREEPGCPIPTNDWWTGLLNARFADALWSYPAMVHPSETGVTIAYPTHWNENGTELALTSWIEVQGHTGDKKRFIADAAIAHDWHDWDVEMLMPDKRGASSMLTTLVHGEPFTWIELTGDVTPRIELCRSPRMVVGKDNMLSLTLGDDCYGLYLPTGARADVMGTSVNITDADFVVVALLGTPADEDMALRDLQAYAKYAYNIPRDTRVSWEYNNREGTISSTWDIETENLETGAKGGSVIQGFLPHQYKGAKLAPSFTGDWYLTPRGTMKMTEGNSWTFAHHFAGMLPWWPVPEEDLAIDNPYRPEVMAELISRYAMQGTMGDDTYWGGKGLLQMAQAMTFALESGNIEQFEMARDKLRTKLTDWLTYTPGETNVFFARYPRWGGLVGEASSYDSDTFNDHHFHYGYFTLAGAMLCMVDDEFRRDYGPMLREIAKDYACWDREDSNYPFLRTMDPWVGHSYAGGLGDQGNHNGNGQESSSESMQGWGGVYLLGVALGDEEMRDAGIFGWSTEARATREYWFDVDARFDRYGEGGNYDHTLYKWPYNTNITCKGIGWWTWFSGDPLHMHGIQWLPVSPALDYLSWDRDFVAYAYNDLMTTPGWGHSWFEDGGDPSGNPLGMLANDDWGNVALAYMQRVYPDEAAAIFDRALENQTGIATSISTGHISYYLIHAHRTYGDIDFEVHADIPTAQMMTHPKSGRSTYVVYNPGSERDVTFYRDGAAIRTIRAPKGKMIAVSDEPVATDVRIETPGGVRTLDTLTLKGAVLDQYGATMPEENVRWSSDKGSITAGGILDVRGVPEGEIVTVTACYQEISATVNVKVSAKSEATKIEITPAIDFVEKGTPVEFTASVHDQYNEETDAAIEWSINGETIEKGIPDTMHAGKYEIEARHKNLRGRHTMMVAPALPDLAAGRGGASTSEENAGSLTAGAFDSDPDTRWGSAHADNQWIAVDLGSDCRLTSVILNWEAAYAADYVIEVAPSSAKLTNHIGTGALKRVPAEDEWQTAASISGQQKGGIVSIPVNANARYVRMRSLHRGTQYGVSLYTMEVHGIPTNADSGYCLGLDIDCATDIIDEDQSLPLTLNAWYADGSHTAIGEAIWEAEEGEITPQGIYTPAHYGTDIISASAMGRNTKRKITAVEVIRPATMSVDIAKSVIVGEPLEYKIEVSDQFGGNYDIRGKELKITCSEPGAMGVDIDREILSFNAGGEYSVTFAVAGLSKTVSVETKLLSDYNLALDAIVTAPGGDNPGAVADGDITTRWQARPGGLQYITLELDECYLIDRIGTVWEAALATEWHAEGSTDGENWYAIGRSSEAPTAGVRTWMTATPAPVKMIRIVGDKLNESAKAYGMSLYEVEIYGTQRMNVSSDRDAPVLTNSIFMGGAGYVEIETTATDNSGYVTLTATVKGKSVVQNVESGERSKLRINGLRQGNYECNLTATDAAGNATKLSQILGVSDPSLAGINLALEKPVSASSSENAGLRAENAVDGEENTRWGSNFADGEWFEVDLGDLYMINRIEILVTDAAFATEALIETSVDGIHMTPLTTLYRTGTGEEVYEPEQPLQTRYLRYTGLKRATGYGVSLNELRVYGEYSPVMGVDIPAAEDTECEIYAIDGLRVRGDNVRPGIYITSSGKKIIR